MSYEEPHAWTPAQKSLIAVSVVAAIIVCLALVYGYQRYQRGKLPEGVERIEELGFGFRRITIAKSNKGQVSHYPFFYYRTRLLCQIGPPPSISPSGNFAVYQDVRSGKLILFRRRDEKATDLTSSFIGEANPFVWHEQEGTVEAVLRKQAMSAVFPLQ